MSYNARYRTLPQPKIKLLMPGILALNKELYLVSSA